MNSLCVVLVQVRGRQYGNEMQLSLVSIASRATANVQAEICFLGSAVNSSSASWEGVFKNPNDLWAIDGLSEI